LRSAVFCCKECVEVVFQQLQTGQHLQAHVALVQAAGAAGAEQAAGVVSESRDDLPYNCERHSNKNIMWKAM
jgi:hypothetical protein